MSAEVLFLGGGGDQEASMVLDGRFFARVKNGGKILYLPQAMPPEKVERTDKKNCRQWFEELLERHVATRSVSYVMHREGNPLPDLMSFDAVYIGGGNTFRLLNYLHKAGFVAPLNAFARATKPIYGGSAGAIVLGRDISTAEWADEKGAYTLVEGLDLCGGVSIDCHYVADNNEKIEAVQRKLGHAIMAIPEDGGLIYSATGNLLSTVGEVWSFEGATRPSKVWL